MSLIPLKTCAEKGELGRNHQGNKTGEKKRVSLAAVSSLFFTLGMQLARYEDGLFFFFFRIPKENKADLLP